ncbi:sugar kinase [Virgisporangium aurantiacum]|uniref:Carbohydrate kinase n=1 Tax=Virgisporangium aurantiacum TaxID=175570 RepID=A0A8J3YYX9_9ACTN|nr:sugar kinase [Virgisporangium aurantiacum]GIJ54574.1 carbohydrate kinase [Virgisporangium aurantiacum]
MIDVVGFGEAMVLFQPSPGEPLDTAGTVTMSVAGAELTLCATVARLGLSAAFCTRVGADPLGRRVRAAAENLGVVTDLIVADPARPTGLFLREALPDGRRRVHYYRAGSAASALDTVDAHRVLAARPSVVAVSGITAALGPGPRRAVVALATGARPAGARLALDPNLRPALGDVDEQAATVRELLPYADFLLLGLDEAGPVFGVTDPAAVFAAAARAGVGETVLKAGADGCFLPGDVHIPAVPVEVVDPVGAGDAFAGAYLAGRLRGARPEESARLGARIAAGVVAVAGDTEGLPARPRSDIVSLRTET